MSLDARQKAMLEEMGIRLFWPEIEAVESPALDEEPALASAGQVTEPVARPRPPVAAPAAAPAMARPTLPARDGEAAVQLLQWDVEARTTRRQPPAAGEMQADWLVVGDAPGSDEAGAQVAQAGKLLDNMLAALGLPPAQKVCIANVLGAGSEPLLRREVEALRPKIILAVSRHAVQMLLQTNEPIGRLRGRVHRYLDVPVVVSYPPAYLLRNLPDKAKAWADLVLAQSVLRGEA